MYKRNWYTNSKYGLGLEKFGIFMTIKGMMSKEGITDIL